MNPKWQALAREATSAAEHMASGVTALGRANYAQEAYYTQAFFSLSIGFERCGKVALVVDHALDHGGVFPSDQVLRGYGHDLKALLVRCETIATKWQVARPPPSSAIHEGIVETLSDFATNLTRYYDLELVTGAPTAANRDGPIAAWFHRVTEPVLALHYKEHHRRKHEQDARLVEELMGNFTLVRHHAETGAEIRTVFEGAIRTAVTEFSRPWERMYVLQISRFLADVMSTLGLLAQDQQLADVPYFPEIFAIFRNEDAYLRGRKTWSVYRP